MKMIRKETTLLEDGNEQFQQKLEAIIEGLQAQIRNVLLQIDVLHQEQRILKTREAEMDAKKDFM